MNVITRPGKVNTWPMGWFLGSSALLGGDVQCHFHWWQKSSMKDSKYHQISLSTIYLPSFILPMILGNISHPHQYSTYIYIFPVMILPRCSQKFPWLSHCCHPIPPAISWVISIKRSAVLRSYSSNIPWFIPPQQCGVILLWKPWFLARVVYK